MPQFHINGERLYFQKCACQLGHPIGNQNVNKITCNNVLCDSVHRTNSVMAKFGSYTADIRSSIFRSYCTCFYGPQLYRLSSPVINGPYVTLRKCV
jgi:hypothetical protein